MNTFIIQNQELVQSALDTGAPAVLVIVTGVTTPVRCTNTLEVDAIQVGSTSLSAEAKSICYGALKAGAIVYVAGTYTPALGNKVRAMVSTTGATAPTWAQITAMESDGIFRMLVCEALPTEEGVTPTDAQKSRIVIVTSDTVPSTALNELKGFVAGKICLEYVLDASLPMNNISVEKVIDADEIVYKTQTELNTLFHASKVAFYNSNGVPCIFGVPTGVTYSSSTPALWFDVTARQTADYVAEQVVTRLRADYPRTKRNKETLTSIKGTCEAVLESLCDRGIIEDKENINVIVMTDATDPYGVIVSYVCDIVTPLYTITIKQSVTLGDTGTLIG